MTCKEYWEQFVVPETIAMLNSAAFQMAMGMGLYSLFLSACEGKLLDVTESMRRIVEMTVTLGMV